LSDRQWDLVRRLSKAPDGLTIDALAEAVGITRPAVRQHLAAIEAEGYVVLGEYRATGGRPVRAYQLTARGRELMPRRYSWFSGVLLASLLEEKGPEGMAAWLRAIADSLAVGFAPRMAGLAFPERIAEAARVLDELAYDATARPEEGLIEATNCVYHELAATEPAVCQFDLAILERLTGGTVEHQECLVRGGGVCRFTVTPAAEPTPNGSV
jgi:predicted ArsR family transcriptional regulator